LGAFVGIGVVETVGVIAVKGEETGVVEREMTVLVGPAVVEVDNWAQEVSSTRKRSMQE